MAIVKKICNIIKNEYNDLDIRRVIGGVGANYGHHNQQGITSNIDLSLCNEYEYTKYFFYNKQEFAIYIAYYYLNIEHNDYKIEAEHYEYKVKNAHFRVKSNASKNDEVNSFEKYLPEFDSNSSTFKNCLKQELQISGFPLELIEKMIGGDLSSGFFLHNPSLNRGDSKLELINEFFPEEHKDHVLIYLDKSWSEFDNYANHDEYLASLLDVFDIILDKKVEQVKQWIDDNCKDTVFAVGNSYKWDLLVFVNKDDALLFKLSWK